MAAAAAAAAIPIVATLALDPNVQDLTTKGAKMAIDYTKKGINKGIETSKSVANYLNNRFKKSKGDEDFFLSKNKKNDLYLRKLIFYREAAICFVGDFIMKYNRYYNVDSFNETYGNMNNYFMEFKKFIYRESNYFEFITNNREKMYFIDLCISIFKNIYKHLPK